MRKQRTVTSRARGALIGLPVAAVVLAPFIVGPSISFFIQIVSVQIVFAIGTNALVGHAGISSFGQAASFGFGAYGTTFAANMGVPLLVALLIGTLLACVGGAIVGAFLRRVTGIAVAMLTLGVAQGIYVLLSRSSFMGGDNGTNITVTGWWQPYTEAYSSAVLALCAICVGLAWIMFHAPFGLTMRSIRDDPERASAFGINVKRFKHRAFVQAAGVCGAAGGLFAIASNAVSPKVFYFETSVVVVIASVLGGIYYFWGPVVGMIIYFGSNEIFNRLEPTVWTLFSGGLLLGVVLLAPNGLLSLMSLRRSTLKAGRGEDE